MAIFFEKYSIRFFTKSVTIFQLFSQKIFIM